MTTEWFKLFQYYPEDGALIEIKNGAVCYAKDIYLKPLDVEWRYTGIAKSEGFGYPNPTDWYLAQQRDIASVGRTA